MRICVLLSMVFFPVSDFLVVVQKTDAATRCDLQGAYWLQVGQEALLLKDAQKKNVVQEWPYEMLRRYGKDKVSRRGGARSRSIGVVSRRVVSRSSSWG